jgi:hypothetical protein
MRVVIASPHEHNDQVAVLSSDGVGGFVSFGWSNHDLDTSCFLLLFSSSHVPFYTLFLASLYTDRLFS